MKKKQGEDVIKLFVEFQKGLSKEHLTAEKKFEELQMMRFKIRPLQGDITSFNFRDKDLIEILWNLGKLDEFFQKAYRKLKPSDRETFYQLFENLHQKYQEKLNSINLRGDKELSFSVTTEMEIFKEELPKKKIN